MFKSIYRKLTEDFAFLEKYGYFFGGKLSVYASSSILYRNNKEELRIGYKYDEKQIYVYRYLPVESWHSENLLKDIDLKGDSYKEQVDQVREFLYSYLTDQEKNLQE